MKQKNFAVLLDFVYLLLTTLITPCEPAKILGIFPTPSYSHQQPLLEISYALASKGHNMTLITTNPSKEPIKNVREIDISSLYNDWDAIQQATISLQKRGDPIEIFSQMCSYVDFILHYISSKPQISDFIKEVNGTKYDLILIESLLNSALLGFAEITGNPPVVGVATIHPFNFIDDPVGNPTIPSYIPQVMLSHTDTMTLYQRFKNMYVSAYSMYLMETCFLPTHQRYLQQMFGEVRHTARELEYNKSLLILSTDLATGYPRPLQPNTIYVGPLHLKKPIPLPEDILKYIDDSEEGVIYFSLGSNMKGTSVPEEIRNMFIKAFQQFPRMRILWKWEADTDLPGRPENVLTRKWLPQTSILAHPKCRLFITQVGLQSLQEAIKCTVPILGIPMFGDQDYNMNKLINEGAGLSLEYSEITSEKIYESIKTILTNSSFKQNIIRLSKISEDKPMSAMDTAIWWVEYVIRHNGAPHLRPASLQLAWYQYFLLDILLIIVVAVSVVIYIVYFVISRLICSYNKKIAAKHKIN